MLDAGLTLACRYSYPPNSFSLCGPSRQKDLSWYSANYQSDAGTKELLQQFSTLYPYLSFIAGENNLKNPFAKRVVEAYWIGNPLLHNTKRFDFLRFVDSTLSIRTNSLRAKIADGALPHHAFHVLNIYIRTGHMNIPHTIKTMDACIINWGKIIAIVKPFVIVETKPLTQREHTLVFGNVLRRKLQTQGDKDQILNDICVGDWVSYHWGYVCEKLTRTKLLNLQLYTSIALQFANSSKTST